MNLTKSLNTANCKYKFTGDINIVNIYNTFVSLKELAQHMQL